MGTVNLPEEIAKKVRSLPTLSVVATKLLETTADETHSLQDIVRIVGTDSVISAQVLRIANSAAFAAVKEITSLDQAVVRLGEKLVVGVALGASTSNVYEDNLEGYQVAAGVLWDHSLRSAIGSREVATYAKHTVPDMAFVAGLLHDIGKSVISEFLKGNAAIMTRWYDEGMVHDFLDAEREIIGTDHSQVGSAIAGRWNLPTGFREVILHHHEPSKASEEFRELVYVVHLGDWVAMMSGGYGEGSDSFSYDLDSRYSDYVSLTARDIEKLVLNVQEEFHTVKKSIMESGGN